MESVRQARTDSTPAMAVLEAVARTEETEATELDTPLYSAVDPDALDRLVEGTDGVTVTFEYDGHTVRVSGDGGVLVDGSHAGGSVP